MPEIAWGAILSAVLMAFVVGFCPGAAIRLIVRIYPPGHPRRQEIRGELGVVERKWRLVWVFEQLELALFEGLPLRLWKRDTWREPGIKPLTYNQLAREFTIWGFKDWFPSDRYLRRVARQNGLTEKQVERLVKLYHEVDDAH